MEGLQKTVADMIPGETGIILGFLDDHLSSKLLEMGFLPGVSVMFNFRAPLGDPICVSVSGFDLSLRIDEASMISISN